MLLRLAYLAVTNVFALLRLLPAGDWDKDVESLALRHQITVLQWQLGPGAGEIDAIRKALSRPGLAQVPGRTVPEPGPVLASQAAGTAPSWRTRSWLRTRISIRLYMPGTAT